ncbi:hypothetical protein MHI22_04480 [Lysinibacillus sp. FSL L8-0312]|uniref:hypothetical protein n=1 Tax=Lysinibacillus sp. FSL L8-0312 TaxID=2921521 RepID=UPI0030F9E2A0
MHKSFISGNNETLTKEIIEKYNNHRDEFDKDPLPLLGRHLLLHTFSHVLLKELAAHSGYATTSLKERLYVDQSMHGVFIYNAYGDSEGSLGGLTALAQPDYYTRLCYVPLSACSTVLPIQIAQMESSNSIYTPMPLHVIVLRTYQKRHVNGVISYLIVVYC